MNLPLALVLLPAGAALAAFLTRADRPRRVLLVATAATHAALVIAGWARGATGDDAEAWLGLGPAELPFLAATSLLFLAASVYGAGYLAREAAAEHVDHEEGFLFQNTREAAFTGGLLLFLATMSLVAVSRHFGLLWVAVEATTLVSAPLIYFHRHHRSLEATWKYLLVCSVGIAFALLGNFFLAGALPRGASHVPMTQAVLAENAARMNPAWLKAAFVLLLVGYGTKMGLAPMHTWLPDAHSEAPSMVSALLSGALLNGALLAILRAHAVCVAAGLGDFSGGLLVFLGLVSMGVAAAFLIHQTDYKRMLAYSSVEHMGVMALGWGVGGAAAFGAGLHMMGHAFTKGMLFLAAGNLLAIWRSKQTSEVRGALRAAPASGALWLTGFLAISGLPPFGLFLSELRILQGLVAHARWTETALFLAFLAVVFVAMARVFLRMVFGEPSAKGETPLRLREPISAVLPPLALGLGALVLGVWIPSWIHSALQGMGLMLGGGR
ncbi:MAG: NADH dehydrogenase FAD-containing subunit [Verrucomicrobiae bacterium]|nr:NADH dehydrogenase FAD-containing subunit [Verrucomicrobiae bacterium]